MTENDLNYRPARIKVSEPETRFDLVETPEGVALIDYTEITIHMKPEPVVERIDQTFFRVPIAFDLEKNEVVCGEAGMTEESTAASPSILTCRIGSWEGKPDCDLAGIWRLRHEDDCPWNEGPNGTVFCDQHVDEMMSLWSHNAECRVVKEPL